MLKGSCVDTLWGIAMPSMDTQRLGMSFCYVICTPDNSAKHHDLNAKTLEF